MPFLAQKNSTFVMIDIFYFSDIIDSYVKGSEISGNEVLLSQSES